MGKSNQPTVISTFAGCGGSSLGYQMAGFNELLAVEWENHAAECIQNNFNKLDVFHGDIAQLTVSDCLKKTGLAKGELDVFDGSPPCQGFSTSGKRQLKDERNSLFIEYCRLLEGLKPKAFVMENVTGMIKGYMKTKYLEIVQELRSKGYVVKGKILNAARYGVPQSRQRVIIIGVRDDLNITPSHPEPISNVITAKEAIKGLPVDDLYLFPTPLAQKWWRMCPPGKSFSSVHPKKHWFNQQKAHPLKPFPTLTKSVFVNGGAGIAHWDYPGQLSIAMAKKAASFPDNFKLHGKFTEQWARLGNSVPPLMMKAIASNIKEKILNTANC